MPTVNRWFCFLFILLSFGGGFFCFPPPQYDVVIRHAVIYDGSGSAPLTGDLAINGDTIASVGGTVDGRGRIEIDAGGRAVSPGFINMLSWATESLLHDGRALSDLKQGITLEVMGEGESMGPLNPAMKKEMKERQGDIRYDVPWTTLGEYLEHLEAKGISVNVASFVGATTIRIHEIGYANRPPTRQELERMRDLVRHAMEEGALGVGSSLIYAPAFYAKTEELMELSKVASSYGGMYISHIRSETNKVLEAVDELIRIAEEARLPAEIYHLKAAGEKNWGALDAVIAKVEHARARGLHITADMYTYAAGATGLDASMPPWVQEGGLDVWRQRLREAAVRARVAREMVTPTDTWENLLLAAGSPDNVLLVGFKTDSLKKYTGKTLSVVAALRGASPQETAMDLVIQDNSRVEAVYFLMSEENVRKQIQVPWVSFGSDAEALAPEGAFMKSQPHPRAYGNVARLLGRYVRGERLLPLKEAVRRCTAFPAQNLGLHKRGLLKPGSAADVVVFDPTTIQDNATYENPHQFASGVSHVFVNGVQVLKDGEHTGAMPGRVVRGPGWRGAVATHRSRLPGEDS